MIGIILSFNKRKLVTCGQILTFQVDNDELVTSQSASRETFRALRYLVKESGAQVVVFSSCRG